MVIQYDPDAVAQLDQDGAVLTVRAQSSPGFPVGDITLKGLVVGPQPIEFSKQKFTEALANENVMRTLRG